MTQGAGREVCRLPGPHVASVRHRQGKLRLIVFLLQVEGVYVAAEQQQWSLHLRDGA